MGKFLIKETKSGVKFDLLASNGQVIGTSEVYSSKTGCKNGIESVKKNALDAGVEDQTVEGYTKATNPKFEIFLDSTGEYRFRLNARNGENILSSEGYKTKMSCLNGIESVKKNAPDAALEEQQST